MTEKKPILIITGPTATGKTRLAASAALLTGSEVISSDSMQVYRKMNIGTAKPSAAEMQGVPHHLINIADPSENFNVSQYQELCFGKINELHSKNIFPIIAGGTGQYISALTDNIHYGDIPQDHDLRQSLNQRINSEGGETLLNELKQFDPETASRLHPNDHKRIVRALEIYILTGKPQSVWNAESKITPCPYEYRIIGLSYIDRQKLYSRINERVDSMMENGLLDEVSQLYSIPGFDGSTASQAIGYKELKEYFDGRVSLEDAVDNIKRESRRYAKRQLTWFNKADIQWLYVDVIPFEELLSITVDTINNLKSKDIQQKGY